MVGYARKAGLLPHELARLLGVHRSTVSRWFNGRAVPSHLLDHYTGNLLDALMRARDKGTLPVPPGVNRRDREQYIRGALGRGWQTHDQ